MSIKHETAMSAALEHAGFDTGVRLHAVVAGLLNRADGDEVRAARALWRDLGADEELRMQAMLALIRPVAGDMRGVAPAGDAGAIVRMPQGQAPIAPATNGGEAGQVPGAGDGQEISARPSPQSREAGAILEEPKGQNLAAPSREPSAVAIAAKGRAAQKSAQSVLDTFRITERQGSMTAIGDIKISSYGRLVRTLGKRSWVSQREHNLIVLLKAESDKIAHIPEGFTARDIFDTKLVEEKIRMAGQLSQHIEAIDAA